MILLSKFGSSPFPFKVPFSGELPSCQENTSGVPNVTSCFLNQLDATPKRSKTPRARSASRFQSFDLLIQHLNLLPERSVGTLEDIRKM